MFETDKEVLDWYERQPRALSKEYVNSIAGKILRTMSSILRLCPC